MDYEKEHSRWWDRDSNPGLQDGRQRRIHGARYGEPAMHDGILSLIEGAEVAYAHHHHNVDDVIADVPPIRQIHGEQFPAKYISQN